MVQLLCINTYSIWCTWNTHTQPLSCGSL